MGPSPIEPWLELADCCLNGLGGPCIAAPCWLSYGDDETGGGYACDEESYAMAGWDAVTWDQYTALLGCPVRALGIRTRDRESRSERKTRVEMRSESQRALGGEAGGAEQGFRDLL